MVWGLRGHSVKLCISASEKSTSFTRNKVIFKGVLKECAIQDKSKVNRSHTSDALLRSTTRKEISTRSIRDCQVRCAHPGTGGGCRPPASRPGTGVSGQGPAAATLPCWSPWSRPQTTTIPVTPHPDVNHSLLANREVTHSLFLMIFHHDLHGFPVTHPFHIVFWGFKKFSKISCHLWHTCDIGLVFILVFWHRAPKTLEIS